VTKAIINAYMSRELLGRLKSFKIKIEIIKEDRKRYSKNSY